ncbi:molybdenum cofactor guanylyltransferase [Heliorestis acidaminivorans]|uniref:Probable molybdenum cofactor guanylyltransferase n=1 Tax=Heliorestis acidaminivorans TaxID=553427 RepID=A0A6I0F4Y4_9FIRM|nr:molybdenum cofactor guanylyltransferase [Heliorestis acidaminivorans]KAB2954573.1 molybdenum cofactor guanylyltransferase [Heliorestis acidaminivorans]
MDLSAIILAGGQNKRMGMNKAFLPFGQKVLIEHIMEELAQVTQEIIIVTNEPALYKDIEATITPDLLPYKNPLCGIHAGLTVSSNHYNFIVACDMPFIQKTSIDELLHLSEGYDVIVPKIGTYLQPLYAVYSKNCIHAIEVTLHKGVGKITDFYNLVKVRYIEEDVLNHWESLDQLFFNVNTPEDYVKAKEKAINRGQEA